MFMVLTAKVLPPALTNSAGLDQYFVEIYSTDHTSSCVTSTIYK